MSKKQKKTDVAKLDKGYGDILSSMVRLLEESRRISARAVNAIMTATYWEIGRRIVELEQGGEGRAVYGEQLIKRLAFDLSQRFGRGFSVRSLYRMRTFYEVYSHILPTVLAESEIDSGPDDQNLPTLLAGTRWRLYFRRTTETAPNRGRVVSNRSAVFPSAFTVPRRDRFETG
jgi:hypothetical protein